MCASYTEGSEVTCFLPLVTEMLLISCWPWNVWVRTGPGAPLLLSASPFWRSAHRVSLLGVEGQGRGWLGAPISLHGILMTTPQSERFLPRVRPGFLWSRCLPLSGKQGHRSAVVLGGHGQSQSSRRIHTHSQISKWKEGVPWVGRVHVALGGCVGLPTCILISRLRGRRCRAEGMGRLPLELVLTQVSASLQTRCGLVGEGVRVSGG